jgi:hypothetical protein
MHWAQPPLALALARAQGALQYAPAGAELRYVGKRGGKPSIKQAQIDELLVGLCLQVSWLARDPRRPAASWRVLLLP